MFAAFCLLVLSSNAFAQGYSVGLKGHDFTGAPGDVLNGAVIVNSGTDKAIGLTVTSADLVRAPEAVGSYELSTDAGKEPRSMLPWLSYSPDTFDLPAKARMSINYQIKVPNDPTLKGTYWAALVVAGLPTQEELQAQPAPSPGKSAVGVRFVFRYIVLITVTIQGAEPPQDKFTKISIEETDSGPVVVAEMENSSTTFSRPQYWLQLKDSAGQTTYASDKLTVTLLPESKRLMKMAFTEKPLPAGQYLLLIVADYGAPKLIGAQAKLSVSPEQAAQMAEAFKQREEALQAKTADAAAAAEDTPPTGEGNN